MLRTKSFIIIFFIILPNLIMNTGFSFKPNKAKKTGFSFESSVLSGIKKKSDLFEKVAELEKVESDETRKIKNNERNSINSKNNLETHSEEFQETDNFAKSLNSLKNNLSSSEINNLEKKEEFKSSFVESGSFLADNNSGFQKKILEKDLREKSNFEINEKNMNFYKSDIDLNIKNNEKNKIQNKNKVTNPEYNFFRTFNNIPMATRMQFGILASNPVFGVLMQERLKNLENKKYDLLDKNLIQNNSIKKEREDFILKNKIIVKDEKDENFEIIWEMGKIKETLIKYNQFASFEFLKSLIRKADSILKKYIKIKKNQNKIIKTIIKQFKDFKMNESLIYNGHLLIIVFPVYIKNDIVASSSYIKKNKSKRSTIGYLKINLYHLINEKDLISQKRTYVLTIVHEILHTIAFSFENKEELFENKIEEKIPQILKKIKNSDIILQEGHWNETYLPNDIMNPDTRINLIMTIYSLSIIEMESNLYSVDKKKLPNNYFLDSVDSIDDLFSYKCKLEDEKSKFGSFCTLKEFEKKNSGCSDDYLFRTHCVESDFLENDCYFNKPYKYGSCMDFTTTKKKKFEKFGHNSRCFESNLGFSSCIYVRIDNNLLFLDINGQEIECKNSGDKIEIGNFINEDKNESIFLICPNVEDFIFKFKKNSCPNNCFNNGYCTYGECYCYDNYDENTNCEFEKNIADDNILFSDFMTPDPESCIFLDKIEN